MVDCPKQEKMNEEGSDVRTSLKFICIIHYPKQFNVSYGNMF